MRVAITGSSGMVGSALAARLEREGHEVVRMRRGDASDPRALWDPGTGWVRDGALEGVDAAVNLGGANIGDGRWTESRKRLLVDSRIETTRTLVDALGRLEPRPRVLVSASGKDYYGDHGSEPIDETAPRGEGFLPDLTERWETEAMRAEDHGIRTVITRFGIVLSKDEGALPRLLTPAKLGAGGPVGSGKQWWAWVALDDVVNAIVFALTHDEVRGPVNVVAPAPVTNRQFARVLGQVLSRPSFMPAPGFALKIMLGQMADEMLLKSQRVQPAALERAGFRFEHPQLEGALRAVLAAREPAAAR